MGKFKLSKFLLKLKSLNLSDWKFQYIVVSLSLRENQSVVFKLPILREKCLDSESEKYKPS